MRNHIFFVRAGRVTRYVLLCMILPFALLVSACQSQNTFCMWDCHVINNPVTSPSPSPHGSLPVVPSLPPSRPPGPQWQTLLAQQAPNCANPSGALWTHVSSVSLSCANGLTMREVSGGCYAGLTLDKVQNNTYRQDALWAQVAVRFVNVTDEKTLAALQIQIPRAAGLPGGFVLAINADGWWVLEQMMDNGAIMPLNIGEMSISPGQTVTLKLWVQNKTLFSYIDDQMVAQVPDDLNPSPGAIGLMVGKLGLKMSIKLKVQEPSSLLCTAPSSPVTYSKFQLDVLP